MRVNFFSFLAGLQRALHSVFGFFPTTLDKVGVEANLEFYNIQSTKICLGEKYLSSENCSWLWFIPLLGGSYEIWTKLGVCVCVCVCV